MLLTVAAAVKWFDRMKYVKHAAESNLRVFLHELIMTFIKQPL